MNDEDFVLKISADDSDARKTVEKLYSDFKSKSITIDIKGKIDPGLQKTLASLHTLKNKASGNTTNDFLIRSQRNAARAVNAFTASVSAASTALGAFMGRMSRQNALRGAGVGAGFAAGAAGLVGGRNILGSALTGFMALPGITQMANYAMAPIRAGLNFGRGAIGAYNTQNRAELQLRQVLKNNNMGDAEFNSIRAYAGELQNRTTIGDEAMLAGAGELSTYVKDGESMKRMMKLLSDYAIGMNENNPNVNSHMMVEFATGLGKAFDGVYDSMRKKGFDTSELEALSKREKEGGTVTEDEKIAALERALKDWDGLAENIAKTDEGKIVQLNNKIGDLKEKVGEGLLPAIGKLGEAASEYLPAIENFFQAYQNAAVFVIERGAAILDILQPFGELLSKFAVTLSENMVPVIGGVSVAVGTLIVALMKLQAQMVKTAVSSVTGGAGLGGLAKGLGGLNGAIGSALKGGLYGILATEILAIGDAAYHAVDALIDEHKKLEEMKLKSADSSEMIKAYNTLKEAEGKGDFGGVINSRRDLEGAAQRYYDKTGILPDYIAKKLGWDWANTPGVKAEQGLKVPGAPNVVPPPPQNITQNNYISTEFDSLGKLIKENLREIAISRMTFRTSAEAAKAMAV